MIRRRRGDPAPVEQLVDAAPTPEENLACEQRSERVAAALAQLSRDQREIIVLRDYLDLSYAEIAGMPDIASGTVMSRIHRARTHLKEVLGGYEQ